jgi:hypothetical protein
MKTWINLETTVLDFPEMVRELEEMCTVPDSTGKLVRVVDFCTVLVGWDRITDERWKADIISTLDLETRPGPIFTAPEGWRMAHVLKALGAFQSVGEAKRNGWDKPLEEGMRDHVVRVRKIRGNVCTFRPPEGILHPGSWEACEID